ncbi:hypothetical protein M407DRAFT_20177 [Tulasnella calospora MUT 4182]|uniref:DUF4139 domain-containing protein n=1 Tax=Tulasnella calospora MUT 4182 TaxID=1051891 RepID=A0A0C3QGR2_9AGAM|nr:hypothetical protein M407DRAFT_20177 [Tulasnella calospora MUT 4182]
MARYAAPMMRMRMAMPLADADEEKEESDDDMGFGLFDGDEESAPPPPITHATAAAIEGATSSTFVIAGKSTIPSHQQDDEQTHKVSVAVIELDAKLEWVTVPKAQTSAFLKCKVKNTSQYILLPGQTSVFMDDNFVCKSSLPSVSPNESFSTSLGVDPAIRITYHPQQKKSKSATGGLLSNKIDVTSYVQRITVKNTRATAATPLFIKDQIPVSEDSDFKVLLTEPRLTKERPEVAVASGVKAHWAPRDSDREDDDKTANAGTEEDGFIEWICDIPAGKTQELSLAWEVSGPAGKNWVRH